MSMEHNEFLLRRKLSAKHISELIRRQPQKTTSHLSFLQPSDKIVELLIHELGFENITEEKGSSKSFREKFLQLVEAAKKSQNEFYMHFLARVLENVTPLYISAFLDSFADHFDRNFVTDLVAVLIQLLQSRYKKQDVDFGRSPENAIEGSVRALLKIGMLNDSAAQSVIARLLEPRFEDTRCIIVQDHIISNFIEISHEEKKNRNEDYYKDIDHIHLIRRESIPYLLNCAYEYQKTAVNESHPGNMMMMPPAITDTCAALFQSIIKTNINSNAYKNSLKLKYTLKLKDGSTHDIFISCHVIGTFFIFLNMVNLASVIRSSNKQFFHDIKHSNVLNHTKVKKQLQARIFSDEKLVKGLGEIFYDLDFLTLPLIHFNQMISKFGNSNELVIFDSHYIDHHKIKILKNIKFEFDRFLSTLPINEYDEDELNAIAAIKEEVNQLSLDPLDLNLSQFKKNIDGIVKELEQKKIAAKIRWQLNDEDFNKLIDQIPILKLSDTDIAIVIKSLVGNRLEDLKNLSNVEFGQLLSAVLEKIHLAKLFVLTGMQKIGTKIVNLIPDKIIAKVVKRLSKSPLFMPHLLPTQVKALRMLPDSNLCESLKQMFNLPEMHKLPANILENLLHPLTHSDSKLCLAIKKFMNEPMYLKYSLDGLDCDINRIKDPKLKTKIVEKLVWHKKKWTDLEKHFSHLLKAQHFIKSFDELWTKDEFKKAVSKICATPIMYNKYNPFICLVLFDTHFSKLNNLDMRNIVDKSELYLKSTLENTTQEAAVYIHSSFKDKRTFESNSSDPIRKIYRLATSNLGVNAEFDNNNGNSNQTIKYYEVLIEACYGLTGLFKEFDPKDEYLDFLVNYCSEVNGVTVDNQHGLTVSQEEIFSNTFEWSKEIFYKIKDILLSHKFKINQEEQEEAYALVMNLALYEHEYKAVEEVLAHTNNWNIVYLTNAQEEDIKTLLAYAFKFELSFTSALLAFCHKQYDSSDYKDNLKDVILDSLTYLDQDSSSFIKKIKSPLEGLLAKTGLVKPDWLTQLSESSKSSSDLSSENYDVVRKYSSQKENMNPKVYFEEILKGERDSSQMGTVVNLFDSKEFLISILRQHLNAVTNQNYLYKIEALFDALRFLKNETSENTDLNGIYPALTRDICEAINKSKLESDVKNKLRHEFGLNDFAEVSEPRDLPKYV